MSTANFGGAYSKGIFPPENAFAPRIIPALVAEGLEWVLVDNIHFERAAANYPYSSAGNDGADGDPDLDGYANAEEFINGTSPNSAGSGFASQVSHLRITFRIVAGHPFPMNRTGPSQRMFKRLVVVSIRFANARRGSTKRNR